MATRLLLLADTHLPRRARRDGVLAEVVLHRLPPRTAGSHRQVHLEERG